MKLFIDSNCPKNALLKFDMLATATGLYRKASVVWDASESNNICFPLNTTYVLMLSSKSGGIDDTTVATGLDEFYKNKQFISVCLKDKCDGFLKNALNHIYPVDLMESLNLKKEFEIDNISRNDVLVLRELLGLGVYPPFFIKMPHRSTLITLDKEGILKYEGKEFTDFTAKNINDYIKHSIEQETVSDEVFSEYVEMLGNDITPVYFDENIDTFNTEVSKELVIEYKKKLIAFLTTITNERERQNHLNLNKNALLFYDIINTNKDKVKAIK